MKISKYARSLTVGLVVPFALMAATSALAKDEKKEGGVLKGAAVGAIVPGVSAGTGAAIGAVSGGVKATKDKKDDDKKKD